MKLVRFGAPGKEKPGLFLEDGRIVDLSTFCEDFNEAFFRSGQLSMLHDWLMVRNEATVHIIEEPVRLGPPVARPSKIVCIGLNYSDHARESGLDPPDQPVVFLKATSAICGPNDDLMLPRHSTKTDWEVELALVIGSEARYVSEKKANDHVAGYLLHNDYSERAFQLEHGGQWVKGKSADTFAPIGPYLVTPDQIGDVHNLNLWLKVNGTTRQQGNTGNMIFKIPELVSYVSRYMTLLPGDVLSTGTPAGVGMGRKPPEYLKPGDVVEWGIDGLGTAKQHVVAPSG